MTAPAVDSAAEDGLVLLALAMFSERPPAWQDRALCAQTDPDAFFPEKGEPTRAAKHICSRCEVCPDCLDYALDNDERFGVWGGMSERDRRHERHRRSLTTTTEQ